VDCRLAPLFILSKGGEHTGQDVQHGAHTGAGGRGQITLKVEAQNADESSLLYSPLNGIQGQLHLLCEAVSTARTFEQGTALQTGTVLLLLLWRLQLEI